MKQAAQQFEIMHFCLILLLKKQAMAWAQMQAAGNSSDSIGEQRQFYRKETPLKFQDTQPSNSLKT